MSRRDRRKRKVERTRRAGLEISRREYEAGRVSPEDYEEIRDFWENAEDEKVLRSMKKGFRKGGPVGRLVQGPAVRLLGRLRKDR